MVATHDMEQTRAWDRVLCLNVGQVAYGPGIVLTREVIETTYGGSIVVLPSDDRAFTAMCCPRTITHPHRDAVRSDVADLLLDPWRSGITSRALMEILLIAFAAGPLGCWVVLFGSTHGAELLSARNVPGW